MRPLVQMAAIVQLFLQHGRWFQLVVAAAGVKLVDLLDQLPMDKLVDLGVVRHTLLEAQAEVLALRVKVMPEVTQHQAAAPLLLAEVALEPQVQQFLKQAIHQARVALDYLRATAALLFTMLAEAEVLDIAHLQTEELVEVAMPRQLHKEQREPQTQVVAVLGGQLAIT